MISIGGAGSPADITSARRIPAAHTAQNKEMKERGRERVDSLQRQ
jgi:hypothetical protein